MWLKEISLFRAKKSLQPFFGKKRDILDIICDFRLTIGDLSRKIRFFPEIRGELLPF
jgi:hypothetical protein